MKSKKLVTAEKQYREQDFDKFNIEVSKLKRALENLQLKYDQEIEDHSIEIQDILNNFAFEKESLIRDFTEEHKAELLDIQNKTKR